MMTSINEIRSKAKNNVESIEVWLRRLLLKRKEQLGLEAYPDTVVNGNKLYNSEITKSVSLKFDANPERFKNPINALFLPELIKIICKSDSYPTLFKDIFVDKFILGSSHLRSMLDKLIPIRNSLGHANPITLLDYYTTELVLFDITSCIKKYFKDMGLAKDYNAPTIIALSDSKGNSFSEDLISRTSVGAGQCYPQNENKTLQVGERLIVEAIIDPSFEETDYVVKWEYINMTHTTTGNVLVVDIIGAHVNEFFSINCQVKSNNDEWHRMGQYDDVVYINYRVIPQR